MLGVLIAALVIPSTLANLLNVSALSFNNSMSALLLLFKLTTFRLKAYPCFTVTTPTVF